MNPLLKELFEFFDPYDVAIIGSVLHKGAEAKDIDILFFSLREFEEFCTRNQLKAAKWDAHTGVVARANLKVPFTTKPIQIIWNYGINTPLDFPYTIMSSDGSKLNEDKPFVKGGPGTSPTMPVSRKKEAMPVIAIDFDGTIRDWDTNLPLADAKHVISTLREKGWYVLIHSCNSPEFIEKWMNDHDIRFDKIWDQSGKPVASVYLDDRGLKFTSWKQALEDIQHAN